MNNDDRPLLDQIEAKDYEAKQDELSRHQRLKTTEAALRALGIAKESARGKLLRLIVRVAGLGVLTRSNDELAREIESKFASDATRAARGLSRMGLIRRGVLRGENGRAVGVALQVDWGRIASLSDANTLVDWTQTSDQTSDQTTTQTSDQTTTQTRDQTTTQTNPNPSIYVPNPLSLDPSSSSSSSPGETEPDDDDDEGFGMDLESIGLAAVRLRDVAVEKGSKIRAEQARDDIWLVAFVGLRLEGSSIIERWARAASRSHPDDFPDYFFSCARKLCEEHRVELRQLRSQCPPCPKPSTGLVGQK